MLKTKARFSFTHHKDGRRALLEIVGCRHLDYLRRKLEKVRQAGRRDLILLVYALYPPTKARTWPKGHSKRRRRVRC
jgi:predicted nuclease of restriction endonuclease-like RecB superfamily